MMDRTRANLLDQLDAAIRAHDATQWLRVVPLHRAPLRADVAVYVRAGHAAISAREALASGGNVAAVVPDVGCLLVHFADERLAALGARLEAGDTEVMAAEDLLAGERVVVNFCDANPIKALHLGHLRNLALGQALSSALEVAGAAVVRQSQVSDYCRSIGEAMAGYRRDTAGETPASAGLKGDHFVGGCYGRYVADLRVEPEPDDPALPRECAMHGDLADELLARWDREDPEVRALWRDLRAWALEGQLETLARLGIRIDRFVYESRSLAIARQLVEEGVRLGVFARRADGSVVYETGEEAYPVYPLARPDGLPTQHLRTMALWLGCERELHGHRSIELVGEEWRAYTEYHHRILEQLGHGDAHPSANVLYGMVRTDGALIKSSNGAPPLVDELLDELAADAELLALADAAQGRADARAIAAAVALGFHLVRPTRHDVDVGADHLRAAREGAGGWIARAWVRASDPAFDGPADPAPEEAHYRYVVLQSQAHRRLLERVASGNDITDLARFYLHISRWYLTTPPNPRVARALRTTLTTGMRTLGLLAPAAPVQRDPIHLTGERPADVSHAVR